MDEPLVVPGHPVDNPPTDDFWPHLDPGLNPVFHSDDGNPAGPYQAKDAKWFAMTEAPDAINDAPIIKDPLVAITDSRVVVLGQPGVDSPPDRRLVTQFRLVCCSAVEWEFKRSLSPSMLFINGMTDGAPATSGEFPFLGVSLVLRFSKANDARAFAQELVRRTARQYLRLGMIEPDVRVSTNETEKEYISDLAHGTLDPSEREATVPFPHFRPIRHGEDYRTGGAEAMKHMVHAYNDPK